MSRAVCGNLEDRVREKVQELIQPLLEEEISELFGQPVLPLFARKSKGVGQLRGFIPLSQGELWSGKDAKIKIRI